MSKVKRDLKGIKKLISKLYLLKDGLVNANMGKLQYYALQSSPSQLDKIGRYILQKVERDLQRGERREM